MVSGLAASRYHVFLVHQKRVFRPGEDSPRPRPPPLDPLNARSSPRGGTDRWSRCRSQMCTSSTPTPLPRSTIMIPRTTPVHEAGSAVTRRSAIDRAPQIRPPLSPAARVWAGRANFALGDPTPPCALGASKDKRGRTRDIPATIADGDDRFRDCAPRHSLVGR